jgi:hypothetical protein
MEKFKDEWLAEYYPEKVALESLEKTIQSLYSRFEWCEQPETD